MRAIDGDRLKRKAQEVATEAWKMKTKATVEVILNEFIDWINEAPTIEPDQKKGKWIETAIHHKDGQQNFYYFEVTCSECGVVRKIGWHDAKFCPNCGSYNGGEQE